ncbi:MAG: type II toxin-antitoxin system PemK/MazF family toxin [Candidatus Woesearchaeota archaeon]|nr:type II toxin-antitoxin system PemK/MazF family toxin [Candidatus Woesearchaeota archaeon]
MYNKKDIVLLPFPYSDLSAAKQRPALILSNKLLNKTEDRICCLITSATQKEGMLIGKTAITAGKLPLKSWVKPQRVFTVHKDVIRKKLCTVTDAFHEQIVEELNKLLA